MANSRRSDQLRSLMAAVTTQSGGVLAPVLVGALAVQLKETLGVSDQYLGLAVALYSLASGLVASVAGGYVDRIGWLRAVRIAAVTNAGVLVAIGVFVRTPSLLLAGLVVGGVAAAITGPTANTLLARQLPTRRQGLAFGIKQAAVPVTTFLAGLSIPTIAVRVGWPWVFVLAAGIPLLAGAFTWSVTVPAAVEDEEAGPRVDVRRLLPLLLGGACAAFVATSLNTFFVASSVASGLTPGDAGLLVAGASAFGLVVRVVSGWVVDRRRTDGLAGAAWLLLSGVAGFGMLATGRSELLAPAALLTYGGGWAWSGLYQFGVVYHHPQAPGRATGVIRIGLMAGGTLGPLTFGWMSNDGNYGAAWALLAVMSVAASAGLGIGGAWLRRPMSAGVPGVADL